MEYLGFERQVEAMHRRVLDLVRRARTSAASEQVRDELLEELSTSQAELHASVEHLQAEHALVLALQDQVETERRRYQALFDLAPDGLVVTDGLGRIREANRAAGALLSMPARWLRGAPLLAFFHPDDAPEFDRMAATLRAGREAPEKALRLRPPRQEAFSVFCAAVPVAGPASGENTPVEEWLWVLRDARERIQAEDQRVRLAEAEGRAAALSTYLAVAAHELRTPLTTLRGYSKVLERHFSGGKAVSPERTALAVTRIAEQSVRLEELIDRLLDASALERGDLELRREETDLAALARRVARDIQSTTEAHEITVTAPKPVVVSVDPLRMEQVLANLIGNAVKHTEGGPIHVTVRSSGRAAAGGASRRDGAGNGSGDGASARWVELVVQDRGPGIPLEMRSQVFAPFFQAGLERHYVRGLGLGLHISKEIVDRHGGAIEVKARAGGGSRFVVRLPAGTGPAREVTPP